MPIGAFSILVNNSKTFSEILRGFGLSNKGGNCGTLKRRLVEEKIDFSHIRQGTNSNKGKKFDDAGMTKEECISNIFINPYFRCKASVKRYLIKYNFIPYECECGLKNKWKNKKLSLQLDHKDGNSENNLLENL